MMRAGRSKRQSSRFAAFVFAVACFVPLCSHAASTMFKDADSQFQFAEAYFERGEYYRAIGEYERFVHFFPHAQKVELAMYKIGLAYLKGEQYEEAIGAFEAVVETYVDSHYAVRSYFGISQAHVGLKRYDAGVVTLQNLIAMTRDENVRDEAYYQCGWVYLQQGMWEEAKDCFGHISRHNRDRYRFEELMKGLEKEALLDEKNPTTAGLLAIIPGAGHLYCERYRDALISFLVNGALIFAAYEAFDKERYALGGIITVVAVGFYSGNIYSAVNSAHKFNRDEKNRFLKYLQEHAKVDLALAGPGQGRGVVLSCRLTF